MKITILFFIFLITGIAHSTEIRRKQDGSIVFPLGRYQGQPLWTQQEVDETNASIAIFSATSPATIALVTPTPIEINLSTTLVIIINGRTELGFDNVEDFLDCQTKAGLERKARKIQLILDSYSAFPASLTADLRQRFGWLKSFYLTLP